MIKPKTYAKEHSLLNRRKYENRKLKRELKKVRKRLDRYLIAEDKGLIDENIIVPGKKRQKEKELREYWACYTKGCKGVLELKRLGENRYFRVCTHCGKHTKTQPWNDSVKE